MIPSLEEALAATMGKKPVSESQKKEIVMMHPDRLITLDDQDYSAYTQEKLQQLAESIKSNGQFAPCLVRRMPDGSLVVLAGRNRRNACKLAGVDVACIIKEYTDAEAEIVLNESNLIQREQLSLREKARGYAKLKESYIAAGEKAPVKKIAGNSGEGEKQIWRYIKLGGLSDWLLDAVEQKQIAMAAGVELAQLKLESQTRLEEYLQKNPDQKIDLEDAKRVRQAEDYVSLSSAFLDQLFHAGVVFAGQSRSDTMSEQSSGKSPSDTMPEQSSEKPISDTMSEQSGGKPYSDTMSEQSGGKPHSDTMSEQSSGKSPSDTMSEQSGGKPHSDTMSEQSSGKSPSDTMSEWERLPEEGLRRLGEESVFTDLVFRYLPEKEWSRKLKKSRWHIATEKIDVSCEAAGISIRKGNLMTALSYHQAYDIIASLIRRGEWLSKEKMAELAVRFWTE